MTRAPTPALHIRGVTLTPVEVPLKLPLGTSADTVRNAPLLLIDVHTEEGITGSAYLFCYRRSGMQALLPLLQDAVGLALGKAAEPLLLGAMLARRLALIGNVGLVRMALSGLDVALWDVNAKAAGLSLAALLGAGPGTMRAYNSNGLGLLGVRGTAEQVPMLLDRGFTALKLRLGYPSPAEEFDVLHAVQAQLPAGTHLMVDYNQGLSLQEALLRGRRLQESGVPTWHASAASAAGCNRRRFALPRVSTSRATSTPKSARSCCWRVRPAIGSSTQIGPTRFWKRRSPSSTATPSSTPRPASACAGTPTR